MSQRLLAFDLEVAKQIPEGETNWKAHRPLGITCAAAVDSEGKAWMWHAHDDHGRFTTQMTTEQCNRMVNDLLALSSHYTIVTWNGLGFDFDVLSEESGRFIGHYKEMVLGHVDLMFQFFCEKGYPLGLDTAAKGMGLPGKTEGVTGAKAPELWANGEYHKVLEYVSQDTKTIVALAQAIQESGRLDWTSQKGRPNSCGFPALLTVKEALEMIPEPDTSWMSDPWPRSKFYGWIKDIYTRIEIPF